MRISAKVDYAVRASIELAAAYDSGYAKADAIAVAQQIPAPFLVSILNQLRLSGVVISRRGADGGYRLSVPPTSLSIADVIRAVDGPLANIAGVQPEDVEYPGNASALRDTWVALRVAIRTVLEAVTLADVVAGELPGEATDLLELDDAWTTRPRPLPIVTTAD